MARGEAKETKKGQNAIEKRETQARKETHKAVIRNREVYCSSKRGLEKREGEKRQKSPAAVYQDSYQKTQRGDLRACPKGAFQVVFWQS